MNNLTYFLAFNRMEKIGPRTVMTLLTRWPDLSELFKCTASELEKAGLTPWLAQRIARFDKNQIAVDLAWQHASSAHHLLSWDSPKYPPLLKEISDPPLVLYAQGQLSALEKPSLAIVGSRTPSITGSENARFFAREIARHGVSVVSGLALGVDGQAHLGCLDVKGQTIAVLGTGIDRIYPRRHANLAEKIKENGLIISEFPLGTPPVSGHFPRRNRIISALSLCILVVEAAIKSGSLITARMALEQNRDVLAIPGSIHNPLAQGCHYLVQQGAKLVTSVADVLEELKINPLIQSKIFSLASEKENLVKFIGFEMTTIDQIVLRSGWSMEEVLCDLASLELTGVIASVPGGYMRCVSER